MKLSKSELMKEVADFIGDNTADDAIRLMEDIQDSIPDRVDVDNTLAEKVEQLEYELKVLDEEWRQRYISRFNDSAQTDEYDVVDAPEESELTQYDDLFN